MKSIVLFFCLTVYPSFNAQTRLYFAKPDGTIDENSYRHIIQATGLVITHDKTTSFKSDTAHFFVLRVDTNYIFCDWKDKVTKEPYGIIAVLGRLDPDKRIIEFKAEENHHDPRPSYIKDLKIYSPDHKVVAFIDGEEIYGAALWLLNN